MRRMTLSALVALLLAGAFAAAPVDAGAGGTGTVRTLVRYETQHGNQPLAGVEVWLGIDLDGSPSSRYACTDERGVARFRGVPSDTDLVSVTGVAVSSLRDECSNRNFLNPDSGKEMTYVGWEDHNGEGVPDMLDIFTVAAGGTVTLRFVARTPDQDGRLCGGAWVTMAGTSGNDRLAGSSGSDVVSGRGGNDTIRGAGGSDSICGGSGGDILRGGGATDILFGGSGNDELIGGGGADFLVGGRGQDHCEGETTNACE